LERLSELPSFRELDIEVLEQALRAHLGLKYKEVSKKKFELAFKKIERLVKRVSVKRLVDEYGFTAEEVALLKKKPLKKVRATYKIERCLERRAREDVASVRKWMEMSGFSEEDIEEGLSFCLGLLKKAKPLLRYR